MILAKQEGETGEGGGESGREDRPTAISSRPVVFSFYFKAAFLFGAMGHLDLPQIFFQKFNEFVYDLKRVLRCQLALRRHDQSKNFDSDDGDIEWSG